MADEIKKDALNHRNDQSQGDKAGDKAKDATIDDLNIEPLSEEDLEQAAGGAEVKPTMICSQQLCS